MPGVRPVIIVAVLLVMIQAGLIWIGLNYDDFRESPRD